MRMIAQKEAKGTALSRKALIGIYEEHSLSLFKYAYRLLGDQDIAEECVAETFSRFLVSLKKNPSGPDQVKAYLYRMAHNWIIDYYRQPPPLELLEDELEDKGNGNPIRIAEEQNQQEQVRIVLLRLPPDQRQVIILRFFEEQSHEEVAALMEKSKEATRALQYRALTTLRSELGKAEEV